MNIRCLNRVGFEMNGLCEVIVSSIEPNESVRTTEEDFRTECASVLQNLRTGISGALNKINFRVRSRGDLQKILGVDSKLSWHVMKLAGPGDPLSLAPFVPTAVPMRRFLSSISDLGVDSNIVEQIRAAYTALDSFVSTRAGDRITFESMAASAMGVHEAVNEDLHRAAIRQRKTVFQANSYYCGLNIETVMHTIIMHPASRPDRFDFVGLSVKFGMRRLRAGVKFVANRSKCTAKTDARTIDQAADDSEGFAVESLDPESLGRYGAPVIARFSTDPLPKFKTINEPNGGTFTRVVGDTVGQASSVNLVFGEASRNLPLSPYEADPKRREFGQATNIRYPSALIIMDQLLHRPSFPKVDPSFSVGWQPRKFDDPPGDEGEGPLPFSERLTRLEAGVHDARIREVPNYLEMLEFVCDRMNWKISDFDVYRVRMEYPLLHTQLLCKFVADSGPLHT
jgi:hypothetical protein